MPDCPRNSDYQVVFYVPAHIGPPLSGASRALCADCAQPVLDEANAEIITR